jgi:uncharacterized membrane protein
MTADGKMWSVVVVVVLVVVTVFVVGGGVGGNVSQYLWESTVDSRLTLQIT